MLWIILIKKIVVCGRPGDKLVVLQLPFGSYVPLKPTLNVQINAN